MDKRRVLLVCAQPLLGEGLEHILRGLEDVELIGPWGLDSGALSRLPQAEPDIVLIADGEGVVSLIAHILERYPNLPVLHIGLEQNAVRMYTSRRLPTRSADLIGVIRGLPLQPHKGEAAGQT